MKKTILLTRPRASSEREAALLAQRGFDCVISPLMEIEATGFLRPDGDFQAVMVTSAHIVDGLAHTPSVLNGLLTLPCYCVGAATATAARALGFTDLRCGASDSLALAQRVCQEKSGSPFRLVHICGEETEPRAQKLLAADGVEVKTWPVYRARAVNELTAQAYDMLARGAVDAVPVFSPRSARLLVDLLRARGLTGACRGMVAAGLSQAVADVLQILPWRKLCLAAKPEEDEILSCMCGCLNDD